MPKFTMNADTRAAANLIATLAALPEKITSQQHQQRAAKAGFEVLSERFKDATSAAAVAAPEVFHHVYEPQQIGIPQSALFEPVMKGRTNQNRTVSWEWRASKVVVDPLLDDEGNERFADAYGEEGFDPSKLNKIHIFVWKAPIIEYGLTVTVRPELSELLVFPNPEFKNVRDTDARAVRPVIFTPFSYTFKPGGSDRGNFTAWFQSWWSGGSAEAIIDGEFSNIRDRAFRISFARRTSRFSNRSGGPIRMVPVTASAAEGARVASLIRGDMDREYIKMAAQRKRRNV